MKNAPYTYLQREDDSSPSSSFVHSALSIPSATGTLNRGSNHSFFVVKPHGAPRLPKLRLNTTSWTSPPNVSCRTYRREGQVASLTIPPVSRNKITLVSGKEFEEIG